MRTFWSPNSILDWIQREGEPFSRSLVNLGAIAEVAYREGRRGRPCSHDQFMARLGLCLFIACHRPPWVLRPEAEEFFLLSLFCCCFGGSSIF